jgi:thiamine biosynthesis lipoprotein
MHRVEHIMGTAISVDITDPLSDVDALAEAAFCWFREVDERFSTYKEGSEVNRLDRGDIRADDCSPSLRHVLDECSRLWRETHGYFDVYATGRLDPSGYVKGWSVQVASDRLVQAGSVNHCLNAGGDVCVRGTWRVGIQHPWERMKVAWALEVTDAAVATSGVYERGRHVVNPFTGEGMGELASVTLVGPDLALADAYATAAVAMGRKALEWLAGLDGYESAVITDAGEAFASPGLPAIL